MKKILISCLVFLALMAPVYAQPAPGKGESSPPSPATEALSSANKVDGLELPADQTVGNDEGFITLQAKTKGSVKWLVVSGVKVKYVAVPDNSIIVSVPPQGGLVTVFAVAVVDGKLTEFARTNIQVNAGVVAGAGPGPAQGPGPAPAGNGLHVTFLIDVNNTTAEVAAILNSQQLRTAITAKGNFFRYYDIKSPVVAQKKLDAVATKVGGSFVIIVQRGDGAVILAQAMPKTEQEVSTLLKQVGGL